MTKHPAAIARDEYFAGDKGKQACDPLTLKGCQADQRQYLENRLEAAFQAGYHAAEGQRKTLEEEAEKQEFFRLVEKYGHLL